MNKICLGCGKILQNTNEKELGYTTCLKNKYCRRCFRLKYYGEKKEEKVDELEILKRVNKGTGIVFFLIDFLNINKETIALFKKIKLKKVLVISKSDILRKEMKFSKIILWLQKVYKIEESILFINNKNNLASNNIFKIMNEENIKVAYIMGITNAGKSTLMNKILKKYEIKKEILASNKPNTTLDFIKIKIADYIIYDTPGFSYPNENLNIISKELKPITYQIKPNTTLNIDDIYKLYFKNSNNITLYTTSVNITREYQKIEASSTLHINANEDIVLPGIGYINVKKSSTILSNIDNLETRLDLSGVEYE